MKKIRIKTLEQFSDEYNIRVTKSDGIKILSSRINDTLFEGRLQYLGEIIKAHRNDNDCFVEHWITKGGLVFYDWMVDKVIEDPEFILIEKYSKFYDLIGSDKLYCKVENEKYIIDSDLKVEDKDNPDLLNDRWKRNMYFEMVK